LLTLGSVRHDDLFGLHEDSEEGRALERLAYNIIPTEVGRVYSYQSL
jgi:hypothetical protein